MYQQQQDALNLIEQGYDEIQKANKQKREAENVTEFTFGDDDEELSNTEKDETIKTLAGAVMDLTERLDKIEKGGE